MTKKQFIEAGANLEHERWAGWQKYLFSKCELGENGTLIIPKELVEYWQKEIETPYSELSEEQKESDRKEVKKYLPLINIGKLSGKQIDVFLELVKTAYKNLNVIVIKDRKDITRIKNWCIKNVKEE